MFQRSWRKGGVMPSIKNNVDLKSANETTGSKGESTIKRKGCKDIWNAFMCEGATFTDNDIPICPTTAKELPSRIILWDEAKHIYKKQNRYNKAFHVDAFVCFYMDDYKFDGVKEGIWYNYRRALEILSHFAGVITPDYSTYQDFPEPIKVYNTYRMRTFGYWLGCHGIPVINNVRWGTSESFKYCFDGIEEHTIVAIGTVGGSPRQIIDRERFQEGLRELDRIKKPSDIIVYGSANYDCFNELMDKGTRVFSFPSHTAKAFEGRCAE